MTGFIMEHWVSEGQTVEQNYYKHVLETLREEKWFLHALHQNTLVPAYLSGLSSATLVSQSEEGAFFDVRKSDLKNWIQTVYNKN